MLFLNLRNPIMCSAHFLLHVRQEQILVDRVQFSESTDSVMSLGLLRALVDTGQHRLVLRPGIGSIV